MPLNPGLTNNIDGDVDVNIHASDGSDLTATTVGPHSALDVNVVQTVGGGSSSTNIEEIGGTPVANQSNAAGSMPSATLDGFGVAIPSQNFDGTQATGPGLSVFAQLAAHSGRSVGGTNTDGGDEVSVWSDIKLWNGNPITSAISGDDIWNGSGIINTDPLPPVNSVLLGTTYDPSLGTPGSPYAISAHYASSGTEATIFAADSNQALWGNIAISPAFDMVGNDFTTNPVIAPFIGSGGWGYEVGNNTWRRAGITVIENVGNSGAIWNDTRDWGGQNVAPAVNLNAYQPTTSDDITAPLMNGILLTRDPAYGQYAPVASTIDLGTFGSRMWVEPWVNNAPITDTNPVPVKNGTNEQQADYIAADPTEVNYSFVAKSIMIGVWTDDDSSSGLTFSVDLRGSVNGGVTYFTYATLTEANLGQQPLRIPDFFTNFYAVRCTALNLGSTATVLHVRTLAFSL